MRFQVVMRAIAAFALMSCGAAVLVARTASQRAETWIRSDVRQAIVAKHLLEMGGASGTVIDLATESVSTISFPSGDTFDVLSFSGWIDERGERQAVGSWARLAENRLTNAGLGRLSYPSGRVLDRVADVPQPRRPPCWYPGPKPRVLFTSWAGTLFQYTFGKIRPDGSAAPGMLCEVKWPNPPSELGRSQIDHLVWFHDARLSGRILASVHAVQTARPPVYRGCGLWWLRLSDDGLSIQEAVRADGGVGDADRSHMTTIPTLGQRSDGSLIVAFRRVDRSDQSSTLCIAPVDFDAGADTATIRVADARALDDGMIEVPAVFAPDGNWVYGLHRQCGLSVTLRRHAVGSTFSSESIRTLSTQKVRSDGSTQIRKRARFPIEYVDQAL